MLRPAVAVSNCSAPSKGRSSACGCGQCRALDYGKLMLDHMAAYARTHDVGLLRLETGIHQHAAIRLNEREGFKRIPPFGSYRNDPVSLC